MANDAASSSSSTTTERHLVDFSDIYDIVDADDDDEDDDEDVNDNENDDNNEDSNVKQRQRRQQQRQTLRHKRRTPRYALHFFDNYCVDRWAEPKLRSAVPDDVDGLQVPLYLRELMQPLPLPPLVVVAKDEPLIYESTSSKERSCWNCGAPDHEATQCKLV